MHSQPYVPHQEESCEEVVEEGDTNLTEQESLAVDVDGDEAKASCAAEKGAVPEDNTNDIPAPAEDDWDDWE